MYKVAAVLAMWLALAPSWAQRDTQERDACVRQCYEHPITDPEIQRQEIVNLEKESARAILLGDTTYFRRVYSDDYSGTLSRGAVVDKSGFITAVQSPLIKYQIFTASDVKVRIFRETAVATCLWSSRGIVSGQSVSSQMRVMHIYVNGGTGWKVVAGHTSALPPFTPQAL
ncbi:MAG TPA: nuclear transport factor 2 family protein [Candidatus Methylomirabilis sp.]|nr:nuclear transport factor 2 family protein [Candidatus Methylomirabilis sp.]